MTFYLYKDNKQEWRWRLKSNNGNIIADSGEGYKNKNDAITMINKIVFLGSGVPLVTL